MTPKIMLFHARESGAIMGVKLTIANQIPTIMCIIWNVVIILYPSFLWHSLTFFKNNILEKAENIRDGLFLLVFINFDKINFQGGKG